ncbi:MAG: SiaB family protein kinase [Deltaproteobacteria bacterium]|nr:SiaB family protein kinase [Deltaproteobacteria bacterium]
MLAREYYHFKNGLNDKGIIFSFTGFISEKILFALGEAIKQKMALEDTEPNITKKVFSIFVEQVQNIIRYSAERISGGPETPVILSSGVITVGSEGKRFFVVCGNVVNRRQEQSLRQRLEHLASLDKAGLKEYYREQLKEPPAEDSQGATLGLIEIARRSSVPVEFDFCDIDANQAFFCLKAYI